MVANGLQCKKSILFIGFKRILYKPFGKRKFSRNILHGNIFLLLCLLKMNIFVSAWFGARHVVTLMLFLGMANAYVMRTNMSVAIVAMVNHTAIANESDSHEEAVDDECDAVLGNVSIFNIHFSQSLFCDERYINWLPVFVIFAIKCCLFVCLNIFVFVGGRNEYEIIFEYPIFVHWFETVTFCNWHCSMAKII